jgi:hypothetical protein
MAGDRERQGKEEGKDNGGQRKGERKEIMGERTMEDNERTRIWSEGRGRELDEEPGQGHGKVENRAWWKGAKKAWWWFILHQMMIRHVFDYILKKRPKQKTSFEKTRQESTVVCVTSRKSGGTL